MRKHDVKFGYEFHRTTIHAGTSTHFRGTLGFDDLDDFLERDFPTAGSSTRATPGGIPSRTTTDVHSRQFPRDITLTLNYGMRWDYFGVIGEKITAELHHSYNPANGAFTLRKSATRAGQPLQQGQEELCSPRRAAWDVTGKAKLSSAAVSECSTTRCRRIWCWDTYPDPRSLPRDLPTTRWVQALPRQSSPPTERHSLDAC